MNLFQPSCALLPGPAAIVTCQCPWLNILYIVAVLIPQIPAILTDLEKLNTFLPAPHLTGKREKENEPYLVFPMYLTLLTAAQG